MINIEELRKEFEKRHGLIKTSELNAIGLDSRKILKLREENILNRIKAGVYEFAEMPAFDEIIITKLFPTAVVYLESALLHYGYTDRIPSSWQIAVDKDISKPQFKIGYPPIAPFYLDKKYIEIGLDEAMINGVKMRIYSKERTICDVLRYMNKLDREVFNKAIRAYLRDRRKNIQRLCEYAELFRVMRKAHTYVGIWL